MASVLTPDQIADVVQGIVEDLADVGLHPPDIRSILIGRLACVTSEPSPGVRVSPDYGKDDVVASNTDERMSAEQWAYTLRESDEPWTQVGSREDTIRAAASDASGMLGFEAFYIAPITETSVSNYSPDAEDLIEQSSMNISDDLWVDAEPIDASKEDVADLQRLVNIAWRLWVARRKIEMPCFAVDLGRRETFGDGS